VSERGSMLPYLGALFFVGFVVVGLALDIALLAATYQQAAFAADTGAEAGAARLEAESAYSGAMRLDRSAAIEAAEAAARSARARTERTATASTDGISVCVVVTDHYVPRILGVIGVGAEGVSVRACAAPGKG
jgi:multidrug efflux pump subunit AcrA (membrane-fusion protein)